MSKYSLYDDSEGYNQRALLLERELAAYLSDKLAYYHKAGFSIREIAGLMHTTVEKVTTKAILTLSEEQRS